MTHIAVISELELGSHKAHAINVVKTAGGFARLGHQVTLLCRPPRWAAREQVAVDAVPLLEQYAETGLQVEFQPFLWTDDDAGSLATGQWAAQRAAELGTDLVYARHFAGALEAHGRGLPTVMETHAHVGVVKPILDECLRATHRGLHITTISPRLRAHYISRSSLPSHTHVVPDGVDVDLFAPQPSASPFKAPGPHVVYCGHLYDYKGIPTILQASALPAVERADAGFDFRRSRVATAESRRPTYHLIGGTHEDQTRLRATVAFENLTQVRIHGHVAHSEVPPYLWHADVLVLPPSATDPSANWTSPVKLGEYLASGKPIVASAIPGLKDWVSAPAVRWFKPDDPRSLADAVADALTESPAEAFARQAAAAALAERFSYPNRARQILETLAPTCVLPKAA